jgi:hypothetical protein
VGPRATMTSTARAASSTSSCPWFPRSMTEASAVGLTGSPYRCHHGSNHRGSGVPPGQPSADSDQVVEQPGDLSPVLDVVPERAEVPVVAVRLLEGAHEGAELLAMNS